MFNGLPQEEQLLHQFITRPISSHNNNNTNNSSSSSSSLIPLLPLSSSSFPSLLLHSHQTNTNFNIIPPNSSPSPSFDITTYDSHHHHHHHHHHQLLVPEFLHHQHHLLHHKNIATNNNNAAIDSDHHHHQHKEATEIGIGIEMERERERERERSIMIIDDADPWTNDEVLSLLRIRSTMENWFPDFTWEHVSRKLAELGFKTRSAEKCKEKFEEESNYFSNNNVTNSNNSHNCTKNFKPFLSELDELYNNHTTSNTEHTSVEPINDNNNNLEDKRVVSEDQIITPLNDNDDIGVVGNKKRKRGVVSTSSQQKQRRCHVGDNKLEMLKGFCEEIVNKMMAQQEEMHNKLLEDMVKRDQEKVRKEEEWKRTEMDRINRELDTMAREQALAGDRQATIIEFLRKFSDTVAKKVIITSPSTSSDVLQNPSSLITTTSQNPRSRVVDDSGKRWPRDEVLALINLRCSLYNNDDHQNDGPANSNKAVPLWERISQGMCEMGFKRSAKRCKEKWENINKYFRKTKDANKKRSLDSRTCPYFHQLTTLYNQGTLFVGDNNVSFSIDDHHQHSSSDQGHVNPGHDQGERSETTTTTINNNEINDNNNNNVVPPAFDFEF